MSDIILPKTGRRLPPNAFSEIMAPFGVKGSPEGVYYCCDLGYIYIRNSERKEKLLLRCQHYSVKGSYGLCKAWVHVKSDDPKVILKAFGFPHSHPSPINDPDSLAIWVKEKIREKLERQIETSSMLENGGKKEIRKRCHVNYNSSPKFEEVSSDQFSSVKQRKIKSCADVPQTSTESTESEQLNQAKMEYYAIIRELNEKRDEINQVKMNERKIEAIKERIEVLDKEIRNMRDKQMAFSLFCSNVPYPSKILDSLSKQSTDCKMDNSIIADTIYTWKDWKICLVSENQRQELIVLSDGIIIKLGNQDSCGNLFVMSLLDCSVYKLQLGNKIEIHKVVSNNILQDTQRIQNTKNFITGAVKLISEKKDLVQSLVHHNWHFDGVNLGGKWDGLRIKYCESKNWDQQKSMAVLHGSVINGLWLISDGCVTPFAIQT